MRSKAPLILLIILSFFIFNPNRIFAQTDNEKPVDLKVEFDSADRSQKRDWNGIWEVPSRFSSQTIEIKMQGENKFTFELLASNGANIGEISGTAKVRGNKAYFDDRESATEEDLGEGCQLLFINKTKSIELKESDECRSYRGNAVYFTGEYLKGKQPEPKADFVQLGVFPNAEMDNKFKKLVGDDYEKFTDVFHLINEGEDLDNMNAKVFEACVRGVCPVMAGIIMYDKTENIYAMVLDINDKDETTARYYSTNSEYSKKLPKTIQKWLNEKRNFSEDLKVILN